MKKIIILLAIMIFAMCGCAKVVEEYPIDARYTESYKGIDTTYEMEWNGETWAKMPNTHSVVFPEKYEIQYRINYDNGTTKTEWRVVARDEYEKVVEKYGLERME